MAVVPREVLQQTLVRSEDLRAEAIASEHAATKTEKKRKVFIREKLLQKFMNI